MGNLIQSLMFMLNWTFNATLLFLALMAGVLVWGLVREEQRNRAVAKHQNDEDNNGN